MRFQTRPLKCSKTRNDWLAAKSPGTGPIQGTVTGCRYLLLVRDLSTFQPFHPQAYARDGSYPCICTCIVGGRGRGRWTGPFFQVPGYGLPKVPLKLEYFQVSWSSIAVFFSPTTPPDLTMSTKKIANLTPRTPSLLASAVAGRRISISFGCQKSRRSNREVDVVVCSRVASHRQFHRTDSLPARRHAGR